MPKYRVTATRHTYFHFTVEADTIDEAKEKEDAIFLADDFDADYEPENRVDWDIEMFDEQGLLVP